MQYETIILELLSRIKILEEEVGALKQWQNSFNSYSSQDEHELLEDTETNVQNNSSVVYTKMTDEMINICYLCGKKVHDGENAQEIAEEIVHETGMNRNSAIMYLYAVDGMLAGTIFKRAISAKAIQKYFDDIFNEYGSKGLKKALHATRLHINYRKECGHNVDSIEKICERYQNKI